MTDNIDIFINNINQIQTKDEFELCIYNQYLYKLKGNHVIDKQKCVLIMENKKKNIELYFIKKIKNSYYLLLSINKYLIWIKYKSTTKKITTAFKYIENINMDPIIKFIEKNKHLLDKILLENNGKFLGNCIL
jgi:hypothetical protein